MSNGLEAVMQRESALLLPTYERVPVLFKQGEGVYLYDDSGRKYLDFLSGIGVNALGYAHSAITQTIAEQSARLVHVSNLFYHEYQAQLAELLTAKAGLDRAFFCNSGTEAWEGALKLARAYARHVSTGNKPKTRLLVMENSFHGRTFGSLATTGQKKYRAPFTPLLPGVSFVRFNDVADLKKRFTDSVCAIGLETIQGEGGIRPVSQEFLATARELTERANAALILDEIQCGLGRTGRYFAYQHYGILPDVVTLAKPLAAGLPLGAILTTNEIASSFHPGMHGTTFGGGPLACAVAVACIHEFDRAGLVQHVAQLGSHFLDCLTALKSRYDEIKEVRGLGLMVGVELTSADLAKAIETKMLERGIVINRTSNNVLRFLPPYLVTREHVDEVCSALDEILAAETGGSTEKKESHE